MLNIIIHITIWMLYAIHLVVSFILARINLAITSNSHAFVTHDVTLRTGSYIFVLKAFIDADSINASFLFSVKFVFFSCCWCNVLRKERCALSRYRLLSSRFVASLCWDKKIHHFHTNEKKMWVHTSWPYFLAFIHIINFISL